MYNNPIQIELKELLIHDKFELFKRLKELASNNSKIFDEIVKQESRFHRVNSSFNKGLISFDQQEIHLNRIQEILLELINSISVDNQLRKHFPGQNFESTFFELLKIQENLLEPIFIIHKKVKGSRTLELNKYEGRSAFFSYFEIFKSPYIQYQSWDPEPSQESIPNYSERFFEIEAKELSIYFRFIEKIIKFLDESESINNLNFYLELFNSKITYYEKIMFFYFTLIDKQKELRNLCVKYKLFQDINKKDLINNDGFEIIK